MSNPNSLSADGAPLLDALIQAVKMERDEFHERCNNSYSTEALMLAKERVSLCKRALLSAVRSELRMHEALQQITAYPAGAESLTEIRRIAAAGLCPNHHYRAMGRCPHCGESLRNEQ